MYGGLFRTNLLGYPIVVSTDPQVNNFILQNDGSFFVPQYPSSLQQLLGKWSSLKARGDYHKRGRGAILRLSSSSVLKRQALSDIENIMIFSITASYLLSLREGTELENLKSNYKDLRKGLFSLPLKVPGTNFYKSLQEREGICNQIKRIIEDREKIRNISSNDLYEDQLSAIQKDVAENETDKFEWTNEYKLELLVRLILASMETTPKVMAQAVKRVCENPHIIPELREEHERIRRTKRENENLSWDDYKSMPFTRCVIKETMRLGYGRVNLSIMRKTIEDVQVEGYTIPKGWTCAVHDGFYSMDTKYYTDPLAFNPRRWQDSNMNQAPFMGFGGGPRLCPGNELATLVVSFLLHHLVTKYRWENIPCTEAGWLDSFNYIKIDCTIRVENI